MSQTSQHDSDRDSEVEKSDAKDPNEAADVVASDQTIENSQQESKESVFEKPTEQSSFLGEISAYRQQLDEEFASFEQTIAAKPGETELEPLDWSDLEEAFEKEMQVYLDQEQKVMQDFDVLTKQFLLWMQVSNEREAERAVKRLRTRMAFVQNTENQLSEKQDHYTKVLQAFQNAVALLGNL